MRICIIGLLPWAPYRLAALRGSNWRANPNFRTARLVCRVCLLGSLFSRILILFSENRRVNMASCPIPGLRDPFFSLGLINDFFLCMNAMLNFNDSDLICIFDYLFFNCR